LPKANFSFNAGATNLTAGHSEFNLESKLLKYKSISFNFNCNKKTGDGLSNELGDELSWQAALALELSPSIELLISRYHCYHENDNVNKININKINSNKSYTLESIAIAKNLLSDILSDKNSNWLVSIGKIINSQNYDSNYEFQAKLEIYKQFFQHFYFSYQPSIKFSLTSMGQKLDENVKLSLGIANKERKGFLEFYNEYCWPCGENSNNILGAALKIRL